MDFVNHEKDHGDQFDDACGCPNRRQPLRPGEKRRGSRYLPVIALPMLRLLNISGVPAWIRVAKRGGAASPPARACSFLISNSAARTTPTDPQEITRMMTISRLSVSPRAQNMSNSAPVRMPVSNPPNIFFATKMLASRIILKGTEHFGNQCLQSEHDNPKSDQSGKSGHQRRIEDRESHPNLQHPTGWPKRRALARNQQAPGL